MAVRSTQGQNRAVRSTQGGGGCHPQLNKEMKSNALTITQHVHILLGKVCFATSFIFFNFNKYYQHVKAICKNP